MQTRFAIVRDKLYYASSDNRVGDVTMDDMGGSMLFQLVPFLIVELALAWGNYLLAVKSGRSGVLWVVLTLIPAVGLFATWYLIYSCIIRLLDRQQLTEATPTLPT